MKKLLTLKFVFIIYFIVTLGVTLQSIFFENLNQINFSVFYHSFRHLLDNENLYQYFPNERQALYKYTPTWALIFGGMAVFSKPIAICILNFTNTMCVYFSVKMLPISDNKKVFILLFSLQELIRTTQGTQTNALYLGLLLMSIVWMEQSKYFYALMAIFSMIFMKIFGVFLLNMYWMYQRKFHFVLYSIVIAFLFLIAPLLVIDVHQLISLYESWFTLLREDTQVYSLYSFKGVIDAFFKVNSNGIVILLIGFFISFFFALFNKNNSTEQKMKIAIFMILSSFLFRQSAEHVGYIIAVICCAFYLFQYKDSKAGLIFICLYYFVTSFVYSDLFPKVWRPDFYDAYKLRAIPSIIVWFLMLWDILKTLAHPSDSTVEEYQPS
jgi:hypothetical protein